MSLTRATLRSRVSGAIGLSNVTGNPEQVLIDGWLDEAVEQFLIETKCTVDTASLNLTAGVGDYVLPSSVLALKRLWIVPSNGQEQDLEPESTTEVRRVRRYDSASNPRIYSLEGSEFLLIAPVAVSSSDQLHWDYVPAPTAWPNPADTPPFIPSWAHPELEEYAKWKAADWDDDTSSEVGQAYLKGWELGIRKSRGRLNRLSGKLSPARAGGSRRRRRVPTRPGIDTGH